MGLYNFKKQFVPFIEDGSKTHTIRATRRVKRCERTDWNPS